MTRNVSNGLTKVDGKLPIAQRQWGYINIHGVAMDKCKLHRRRGDAMNRHIGDILARRRDKSTSLQVGVDFANAAVETSIYRVSASKLWRRWALIAQ